MGNSSKSHGFHGIHGIYPMKSYHILWETHQNLMGFMGFMGFIFHFKSCVSYTIANQTGFRGSLLPGCAPSSPHPVVFCCWTFWKGASCVCTTLPLTGVLERGWARSSAHHGAKRPLRESSPRPLHFNLTLLTTELSGLLLFL